MGGEPWLFTPNEIGQLTDAQIWHQYVRPAVRRQRDARRGDRRPRKKTGGDGIPDRAEYISLGLQFGLTVEHCEREYDAWAASEEGRAFLADREARKAEHGGDTGRSGRGRRRPSG